MSRIVAARYPRSAKTVPAASISFSRVMSCPLRLARGRARGEIRFTAGRAISNICLKQLFDFVKRKETGQVGANLSGQSSLPDTLLNYDGVALAVVAPRC